MKAIDWLMQFPLFSREGCKIASKSERRRWFEAGAVLINAEQIKVDEQIDFAMISVILFSKGKRITLL